MKPLSLTSFSGWYLVSQHPESEGGPYRNVAQLDLLAVRDASVGHLVQALRDLLLLAALGRAEEHDRLDVVMSEVHNLVLDQRDERRHNEGAPGCEERGQLVCQRLSTSRRHDAHDISPVDVGVAHPSSCQFPLEKVVEGHSPPLAKPKVGNIEHRLALRQQHLVPVELVFLVIDALCSCSAWAYSRLQRLLELLQFRSFPVPRLFQIGDIFVELP